MFPIFPILSTEFPETIKVIENIIKTWFAPQRLGKQS